MKKAPGATYKIKRLKQSLANRCRISAVWWQCRKTARRPWGGNIRQRTPADAHSGCGEVGGFGVEGEGDAAREP